MVEVAVRVCTACGAALPMTAYPPRGRRCLECRRAAGRQHYADNRAYYVAKARRRNRRVITEVRAWVAAYLAEHPCVDCGNDDVRTLEFDHREGTAKTVEVSILARNGYSLERVRREVELCDVRCANCHRIRTHTQRGWWGSRLDIVASAGRYAPVRARRDSNSQPADP